MLRREDVLLKEGKVKKMKDLLTPFKHNQKSNEEISMPSLSQVGNWIADTTAFETVSR